MSFGNGVVTIEGIPEVAELIRRALAKTDEAAEAALMGMGADSIKILQGQIHKSIYERPGHPTTIWKHDHWRHGKREFGTPAGQPGEKSSGDLENSIDAHFDSPGGGSLRMTVGTTLPQGFYASIDVAATPMNNRPIFMWTKMGGRFRTISTRPPMPKHPFLEMAEPLLVDLFMKRFNENFEITSEISKFYRPTPFVMLPEFMGE